MPDQASGIRELTDEGVEVMEFVVSVFRGTAGKAWRHPKYRMWAIEWISDRLWGKPVQAIQSQGLSLIEIVVHGPDEATTPVDGEVETDTISLELPISP